MNICNLCRKEMEPSKLKLYCSDACRQKAYRNNNDRPEQSEDYTAEDITIKDYSQNTWSTALSLAAEYNRPVEWVHRSLEACRLARVGHDYFIDKYLKKLDIPMDKDVNAISWDMQKELRFKK